jgi:hypothetical protein
MLMFYDEIFTIKGVEAGWPIHSQVVNPIELRIGSYNICISRKIAEGKFYYFVINVFST